MKVWVITKEYGYGERSVDRVVTAEPLESQLASNERAEDFNLDEISDWNCWLPVWLSRCIAVYESSHAPEYIKLLMKQAMDSVGYKIEERCK